MSKLNYLASIIFALFFYSLLTIPALAHVIVTPNQVGIGKTQLFDISVPNEEDNPTTELRLVIPDGVKDVVPTIVPSWTITTKTDGNGNVTEINWTNGSIPAGQRADFTFKAQVPAQTGVLKWKAYQSYENGQVKSWDQDPVPGKQEDDSLTPYSQTQVIDDLQPAPKPVNTEPEKTRLALMFAGVALFLAVISLALQFWKKFF